jgi:hypothetical protein
MTLVNQKINCFEDHEWWFGYALVGSVRNKLFTWQLQECVERGLG